MFLKIICLCCRLLQGSCQAVCGNSFHCLEIPCLYPWEQRSYAPWRIHQPPDSGENIHWFKPATFQHFCLHLSSTSALSSHYLHYSRSIYIVSTSNILISIEYTFITLCFDVCTKLQISHFTHLAAIQFSVTVEERTYFPATVLKPTQGMAHSNWVLVVDLDWKIH